MKAPAAQLFTVTLRHLSSDGKKAGADLPKAQLHYVALKQLGSLLNAVAGIAPTVAYPAEPEVRISGPAGEYVVRVKDGRLHLVSWSSAHKGGEVTPAQVLAAVSGEEADDGRRRVRGSGGTASPMKTPSGGGGGGSGEKLKLAVLGAAIVAVNCFTIWMLTRPPRSLLDKYRLLDAEPAERVMADVAGSYETGKGPGNRRMIIAKDASVQRMKIGAGNAIKDQQNFTVKPAEAAGNKALLTSRKSLIKIKDPLSVVLYGDTYTRVNN